MKGNAAPIISPTAIAASAIRNRLRRADTRHRQRRQADEGEEHGHLFDETADARCGIGPVADVPSSVGKGDERILLEGMRVCVRWQEQAVVVVDQAARHHKAGSIQRVMTDEHMRSETEATRDAVRLARQRRVDAEGEGADAHEVARLELEAIEKRRLRHRAADCTIAAQGICE